MISPSTPRWRSTAALVVPSADWSPSTDDGRDRVGNQANEEQVDEVHAVIERPGAGGFRREPCPQEQRQRKKRHGENRVQDGSVVPKVDRRVADDQQRRHPETKRATTPMSKRTPSITPP